MYLKVRASSVKYTQKLIFFPSIQKPTVKGKRNNSTVSVYTYRHNQSTLNAKKQNALLSCIHINVFI